MEICLSHSLNQIGSTVINWMSLDCRLLFTFMFQGPSLTWVHYNHVGFLTCKHLVPSLTVNYDVTSARDMLLLALTQDEQKKWIGHLGKKIPKTPPSTFSRASPRSMSTRSGPNQSFRKNPKSNTGKLR